MQPISWVAASVAALIAVIISDTLYRRIPNTLALTICLLGCAYWWVHLGWLGLGLALKGAAVGGGLMLFLYLPGWVGAGDVKVFAGMGALLGAHKVVSACLIGLCIGGLMSVTIILAHQLALADVWRNIVYLQLGGGLARARARGATVPLAAALSCGALLVGAGFIS